MARINEESPRMSYPATPWIVKAIQTNSRIYYPESFLCQAKMCSRPALPVPGEVVPEQRPKHIRHREGDSYRGPRYLRRSR
jgi:hypothetical protein